jgi:hypothetical protein
LHGNAFTDVADINTCSTMCSQHPKCTAWEYDSTKKCILRRGSRHTYKQNANPSVTTYAGLSAGVSGCVAMSGDSQGPAHNKQCSLGTYRWTDGATDKSYCRKCPKGKYSHKLDATKCYSVGRFVHSAHQYPVIQP